MEYYKNINKNSLLTENWRPVVGYEKYQVSNLGRVKSANKILKQHLKETGYLIVNITNGVKWRHERLHRLVAFAFIERVQGKNYVNHTDGDKTNNVVANLEWCTYSENHKHAYKTGLKKPAWTGKHGKDHPHSIPVLQYNKNGEFIKRYDGAVEAAKELKIQGKHICSVCKGKRKSTGGFVWQYESLN